MKNRFWKNEHKRKQTGEGGKRWHSRRRKAMKGNRTPPARQPAQKTIPGPRPDYQGGGIVNLMTSIIHAFDGAPSRYPPLKLLDPVSLRATKNIVLLVIDGMGHDFLTRTGRESTLHEHLKGSMTSVFPPTTAAAITTFLTGQAPQQHGLTGWFTYFSELGTILAVLPFRPRLAGTPLGTAGIDAAEFYGHEPVFDRINAPSFVVSPGRIAYSDFNAAHAGKAGIRAYSSLAGLFRTIKDVLREGKGRQYIHAYWSELDRLAHDHGIESPEVAAHFTDIDKVFGRFLKAIKGTDTMVIVVADHGFIDGGPDYCIELDDHPRLKETLLIPLCGERRLAYCYVHANKRKQFEDYIQTELADYAQLFRSEDLITQGYFGLGPPHPQLKARIGDYTLAMTGNYTIKDWLPGERYHVHIGSHGGLSEQEMRVPLIVVQA
ncbi:MAG: alkaline phosphatase family protein [Gammaproteobacteria bacterium]|nr:MAG: alkaline phosphatase family protein [Gammaproteobacteria bacterium]